MTVFVFDIETVPDLEAGRLLYGLEGLPDADVLAAMNKMRREAANTEFQRIHLHKIVAISLVMRTDDALSIWSLGTPESSEPELIQQFFAGVNKYVPRLVSWNGSGFDLPVLHHRAFVHGIQAGQYWEQGEKDRDFKFDNYISRYHQRHIDVMDVLAGFNPRANAPLDEMAQMIGLPGKMGIGGAHVAEAYLDGKVEEIRHYCEIDVLNTYLLYMRFQLMRGHSSRQQYVDELHYVRDSLLQLKEFNPYFETYLAEWPLENM
jgi:predicted PolB exonuclease-like 3'-5' exonuclease